jgi:ribulose-phosphate 3-epimerase
MKQTKIIAPSVLAANFAKLGEDCDNVIKAGATMIHYDVMDNHFVPNLSFGADILKSLRDYGLTADFDVHLMVEPVDEMIVKFIDAKANFITFHPEASKHIDRSLQLIKDAGIQAGLVLNPSTPLNVLDFVLDKLDMIVLMSVNPGFGGQKLIPSVYQKAQMVRKIIDDSGLNIRLEVDGGVTLDNIAQLNQCGFDTFVAGSAIFKSGNYQDVIQKMYKLVEE